MLNLPVQHLLLLTIINATYQENALPALHIKIHHTSYKILYARVFNRFLLMAH